MSFFEFPNTRTYDTDLGWLIKKMGDVLLIVDQQNDKIAAVEQLTADLKAFVNNYFDNLDVQREINNKIDQMAADGTLLNILQTPVESWTADYVSAWLQKHIDPATTVVIDDTLSIAGAAADAKAAGDAIKDAAQNVLYSAEINGINLFDRVKIIENKYINNSGGYSNNTDYVASSDFITVDPSQTLYFTVCSDAAPAYSYGAWYDSNKDFISQFEVTRASATVTSPANARYLKFSCKKAVYRYVILSAIPYLGSYAGSRSMPNGLLYTNTRICDYALNGYSITNQRVWTEGTATGSYTGNGTIRGVLNGAGAGVNVRWGMHRYNAGEYFVVKATIRSSADIPQLLINGDLLVDDIEANKPYTVVYRKNFTEAEDWLELFSIRTTIAVPDNTTVTLSDIKFLRNRDIFCDSFADLPALKYNKNFYIVSKRGDGHFCGMREAIDYITKTRDARTENITIYVRNGRYRARKMGNYNWAYWINHITVIGESRDNVVFESVQSADTQYKIFDIGGHCSIENLTCRTLNDGTYDAEHNLHVNPYCIHVDRQQTDGSGSSRYITSLRNLTLYNECESPIGCGLHNNQTICIENCFLYRTGTPASGSGTFYIHQSWDTAAANMEAIGRKNIIVQNTDGVGYAVNLNSADGGYTQDIKVELSDNIVYAKDGTTAPVNFKEQHDMVPWSLNNSLDRINY